MSTAAKSVPAAIFHEIGQAYGGGFISGITVEDGKRYLNITAGAEHELVGAWGARGVKIEGADSFTDSRANTEAMAAGGSETAQKVVGLIINGFSDWAIPARDVQELQYRHFKPTTEDNWQYNRSGDNPNSSPVGRLYTEQDPAQTAFETFREGGPEAFQERAYWSSSQRSAYYAFLMHFADGLQDNIDKNDEFRVRPVRRELILN